MKFYIYAHIRNDTNTVFYIGKGKKDRAFVKHKRNNYWNNIVNSVGYTVEILEKGLTEDCAFKKEMEMISRFKKENQCEANLCPGGKGSAGYKWTKEQRANFSKQEKGRKGRRFSHHWTEDQKETARNNMLGKRLSTETIKKISNTRKGTSNPFYGKTHSKDAKLAISKKNKKLKKGSLNPAAREVMHIESKKVFKCMLDAASHFKVSKITVSKHCRNKVKVPNFKYIGVHSG